jgi:hypothetical protein
MKVTVSYGCDLDDVPNNISQLLGLLSTADLRNIENLVENAAEECVVGSVSQGLETIDNIRRSLAKLDERLMDYAIILSGYIKAKADIHTGIFEDKHPNSETLEGLPEDLLSVEGSDVDIEEIKETNDQVS